MSRHLKIATVALVAAFSLVVWTEAVYALTASTRICVSGARRNRTKSLQFYRALAAKDYQDQLKTCFTSPQYACVTACNAKLEKCQNGDQNDPNNLPKNSPNAKKAACVSSEIPTDGLVSCLEKFDADIDACTAQPSTGNPGTDAANQLACAQRARLDRFNCNQACASAQQLALDNCNQGYNDCIEFSQLCR